MTLRPIEAGDREEFVRVLESGKDAYAPWLPALAPRETWEHVFERDMEKASSETHLRLVGILSDGRIVGSFNLGEIVRGHFDCAYASWRTDPELWGQGFGAEGVSALLDVAFSHHGGIGLHRVQANIIPSNIRSIRLAERVGFRKEGLALKYLKIAGAWEDHLMFAKVTEEHQLTVLLPSDVAKQGSASA
jgi:ribosomal-protein-alanine N-acetyltransferase